MSVPPAVIKSVMKAIYNLCDEDNYNIYDAKDIAEYLGLDKRVIDETIDVLMDARCIAECMNIDDDGVQTYHLTDKAIDMVEMG
jgi:DNA-binding MarR family transcriptional regulator